MNPSTASPISGRIVWPEEFSPLRAKVHVENRIDCAARPEHVWECLVDARRWPEWYPNAHDVELEGGAQILERGVTFRWRTFGVRIVSRVEEFVPYERLAWTADGVGVRAYHAWLVEERAGGSSILTEETQHGWLARLGHLLLPNRMHRGHDLWLASLDAVAKAAVR